MYDLAALRRVAWEIGVALRRSKAERVKEVIGKPVERYHGFYKYRFSKEFLKEIQILQGLDLDLIQIELIGVQSDLRHEIHYHEHSAAYVMVVGELEHLPTARNAFAYCGWPEDKGWEPIDSTQALEIPQRTRHGFTVEEGGILYFISVQSPPITGAGYDDYHRD
jgi:hypothetical protein